MDRVDRAVSRFNEGFNCCQAIVSVYGPELGLDDYLSLRLSSGFGVGIARLGDICGAISGGVLILGLKYGGSRSADSDDKNKLYSYIRKFIDLFEQKSGQILCNKLINIDISTLEGMNKARADGVFTNLCPNFVRTAAEILEKLI